MLVPGSVNPLLAFPSAAAGYQISRSLRFNSSDSAYLSRTPASAGNRRTFTWAAWIKRSALGSLQFVMATPIATNTQIYFDSDDQLVFGDLNLSAGFYSVAKYRDPSAWYHVVIAVDTTQATASNRVKMYVNGAQLTGSVSGTFTQNYDFAFNSTVAHDIGRRADGFYFSGYLADIHFIDGQALTPSSFGETDANGEWQPKAYTGTYGTNGFKLDFADNSAATAAALGKDTSPNGNNWTPVNLSINTGGPTSVAAAGGALPIYNTTDTYGATKGTGTRTDSNSSSIVLAIPMDGANNGTTFTDESATIKGSGSAKIITRVGDVKTVTTLSKYYGSSGAFDASGDVLTVPAGADFAYGTGDFCVEMWIYPQAQTIGKIIYSQAVSGTNYFVIYQSPSTNIIDFYATSSGAGTPISTSSPITINTWSHLAVTRQSGTVRIFINGILSGSGTNTTDFTNTTYVPTIGAYTHDLSNTLNGYLQDFRIYKGVAKYTSNFNPPSTTQNATVGAGNDSLVDTPTSYGTDTGAGGEVRGNYCTLNPLDKSSSISLANGNLDHSISAVGSWNTARSTIAITSGKWYWEVTCSAATGGGNGLIVGVVNSAGGLPNYIGSSSGGYGYSWDAFRYNGGVSTSYGAGYTNGDILGVAFDATAWTITFYKNGISQGTAYSSITPDTYFPGISLAGTLSGSINFGQRPFAYTAPSGFKALCDTNLPAPVVAKPSTVMDVKLITANNSTQTISGFAFSPDLVWTKSRSQALSHYLYDTVRGVQKPLSSNSTGAESTITTSLTAFNSDGFTVGPDDAANYGVGTGVAWCWDAGSSNVVNTQGTITSTVRANPSAGFSIVTWTGNGSASASVGHGLGVTPAMYIVKARNNVSIWPVFTSVTGSFKYLDLSSTAAAVTPAQTAPTSTTFNVVSSFDNANGYTYVAYCFAPVAGYSSMGSYVGNGSSDGVFQWCGFRPRWLLIKSSSGATENWVLIDSARDTYNVAGTYLLPNLANAEGSSLPVDLLSNGFKLRGSGGTNQSAVTYVWAAFAESPFAYSRAR